MTARLLPTLVALTAMAFPAAAAAQTSDYGQPPPLSTDTTQTTTPPTTPTTPKPTPKPKVAAKVATGSNPTPPTSTVAASTGTTPTTLAYTGSEVWLVALLGAFALAGGVALMRTSRRA